MGCRMVIPCSTRHPPTRFRGGRPRSHRIERGAICPLRGAICPLREGIPSVFRSKSADLSVESTTMASHDLSAIAEAGHVGNRAGYSGSLNDQRPRANSVEGEGDWSQIAPQGRARKP